MKKIIALLLVVCTLCVGLVSCVDMKSFIDNLGDDYEIKNLTGDEVNALAALYGVEAKDYGIGETIKATHKERGTYVYIFECSSEENATALKSDTAGAITSSNLLSSVKITSVVEAQFVLIGAESVIQDALD